MKTSADKAITAFARRIRRSMVAVAIVRRLSVLCIVTASVMLATQLVFVALPWTLLPLVNDVVLVALAAGCISIVVDCALVHAPGLLAALQAYEKRDGSRRSMLSIAFELLHARDATSASLKATVAEKVAQEIAGKRRAIHLAIGRARLIVACCMLIAAGAALLLARPSVITYWNLPFAFLQKSSARISPGTLHVPRNAKVALKCESQQSYPAAELSMTSLDGTVRERRLLRPDEQGVFAWQLDSLKQSLFYAFTIGTRTFPAETVFVIQPPQLSGLQITVQPPAYIAKKPAKLRKGQGSFSAYAGSAIYFDISATYPLRSAELVVESARRHELDRNGPRATGTVKLDRNMKYSIALIDTLGQAGTDAPSFFIDMRDDREPGIRFLKPARNVILTSEQTETLVVEGTDDIGIAWMNLYYRTSLFSKDSAGRRTLTHAKDRNSRAIRKELVWDLTELSLYPGDTVFYWAKLRDTKPFGRAQLAVSDTFFFRLPGFSEIHRSIARKENYTQKTLKSAADTQKGMRKNLENLMQSAQGKKELSWEEKEIAKELAASMQAQHDSLQKAVKSLQETVQKLREEGLSSDQVVEKMEQIKKSIQDLVEQFGDSTLFKQLDKPEELTGDDVRRALQKLEKMMPDLEERLDMALRYLEMLKRDKQLAELAAQAGKMAGEQHKVAQASEKQPARGRELQEKLLDEMERLSEQLEQLSDPQDADRMFDKSDIPSQRQVARRMQQMRNSLQRNRLPSQQDMHRMSGAMSSLSRELESMLSANMTAKMQREHEMMLNMAHDALSLADWQESTSEVAKQAHRIQDPGSIEEAARMQQGIREALRNSIRRLDSISMIPPRMNFKLLQDYNRSIAGMDRALANLDKNDAASFMQSSRNSLHGLAQSLLQQAGSMQGQGQGGQGMSGMMSGLRKLSGKQAALNSMTGEMLRQMLQGRMDGEGGMQEGGRGTASADARRAARQAQEEISRRLKELSEKYGEAAGEGMHERVKQLEEEARRLARLLENPNRELADRQDRFLVKLLQTALSMHKQDEGKQERKSLTARTIYEASAPLSPGQIAGNADSFYRLRERAFQGTYPESYQSTVRAYFDSLGVLFLKEE
ncbi:MAG: hypothetical protein GF398_12285 [Chitinivibrionales bacterium]|nr:hypothetical protein [Chitinivibrionales bacterium]